MRDLLNVCNNNTTFGLSQSAASVSDTPVRLKQDQSHQTWYESLDLKQDNNNAKIERPCLKTVSKKNTHQKLFTIFVKSGSTSNISVEWM